MLLNLGPGPTKLNFFLSFDVFIIPCYYHSETNLKTLPSSFYSAARDVTYVTRVFSKHTLHYLNVYKVGTFTVYDIFDCTFECLQVPSCVSVNLAANRGVDGKLWCEALSSDIYRNTMEYKGNESSHHFSMKVKSGDFVVNFVNTANFLNGISIHSEWAKVTTWTDSSPSHSEAHRVRNCNLLSLFNYSVYIRMTWSFYYHSETNPKTLSSSFIQLLHTLLMLLMSSQNMGYIIWMCIKLGRLQ